MVDRIALEGPEQTRRRLDVEGGIDDAVPALCEDLMQFVVEDVFADGRLAFEAVSVEVRADVGAFEMIKQPILDAAHMLLGYHARRP